MSRDQINDIIRSLGHDPDHVRSIEFRTDGYRVVEVEDFDNNMRSVIREYRYDYKVEK